MSDVKCPACGSHNLQKSTMNRKAMLTLGGTFDVVEENYKCLDCGEEGDFALKNEKTFLDAERRAKKEFVPKMIDELSASKVSMARFERAFELPQRTLTRWKTGDFSASGVALLRTVSSCPWLVDVAEHGFDKGYLNSRIISEGVQLIGYMMAGTQMSGVTGMYLHSNQNAAVGLVVATQGAPTSAEYQFPNAAPTAKVVGG